MILVIDNYDSFTFNLVQMIASAGNEIHVVRNDELRVNDLLALRASGIVVSPGPGRPESAGCCVELLQRQPSVPILGVCLGHQVLAHAFGGEVGRAPSPVHGKTTMVHHCESGIFAGLGDPFVATRYHSLAVIEDSLPDVLEPLAWSTDGVLMALRHQRLPYWGVQFHPESIMTEQGPLLIENFLALCSEPQVEGEP